MIGGAGAPPAEDPVATALDQEIEALRAQGKAPNGPGLTTTTNSPQPNLYVPNDDSKQQPSSPLEADKQSSHVSAPRPPNPNLNLGTPPPLPTPMI
jgi:hypothetical protein